MFFKSHLFNIVTVFFHIIYLSPIDCMKINITDVEECPSVSEVLAIELSNITYIPDEDGYITTIHGSYVVKATSQNDRVVNIKSYKCAERPEGLCSDNLEDKNYSFTCDNYMQNLGPWSIVAESMSGPRCSHNLGTFPLENAKVKPEYLMGYLDFSPKYTHYRFLMSFSERGQNDTLSLRLCLSIQFDTFDITI